MNNETAYENFLSSVADRYRRDGYKVIVGPKSRQLPGFLSGFAPDIVARGKDRNIVVQIRTRSLTDRMKDQMKRLAQLIEEQEEWRLDLVYFSGEEEGARKVPSKRSIRSNIEQAQKTYQNGNKVGAFLQAWSAFEAAAIRAVRKVEDRASSHIKPQDLLKALVFHGFVEDDIFERLSGIARLRNQIAHGELNAALKKTDFNFVCVTANELLAADLSNLELA